MLRRFLLPLLLVLFVAGTNAAQAQTRKAHSGRGTRARTQPKSSDDVKLAPGMRIGRPLALTTDYMGRPLKPKAKLTSTPVKTTKGQATSMSASGSTSAGGKATTTRKSKRR
ncbi:hypothetical protein [Hymenobacter jeollabukensis]|uniref:Secreted protein n=1 Tax=Hymenobacter jeollabukensis TaxID=2025313 RepID=A0A5R8WS79_9BACT|nr:hypothetical protein [Hymenobacter jeollabukensis]TLM94040.1 hypothetical protein FDY95_08415 [Hymenobacter jeollabukensis]